MVRRWDIVTIGNLSRNRYWGEEEGRAYRAAICTSTLISGDGFRLFIDPSLADEGVMAAELNRRTGLKLSDIDTVFVTHEHGDHHAGLRHFPNAEWLASAGTAEAVNGMGKYDKKLRIAEGTILGSIGVVFTPGHTSYHHGLRFACDGLTVVIAGDAVMTRDFWKDRRGYHNSVDPERVSQTIDELGRLADIIVPGHDNYFLTEARG
jgi:glyoxylase-like metal-dependent hydrolase (beta-lactamase superfamily II)